tara:strand:- start:788 stop:1051 length:264 start_codon:yes stop_codon:yes gene_type:complete
MKDTIKNPEELCAKRFGKAETTLSIMESKIGQTSIFLNDIHSYLPHDRKVNGLITDIIIHTQRILRNVTDLQNRIKDIKNDNNVEDY